MVPDWETNTVYFSQLLSERHPDLWQNLRGILRRHHVPVRLLPHTNDIWARDYCPIQLERDWLLQLAYNPDYLRGHENLITRARTIKNQVIDLGTIRSSRIIMDGGNVVAAKNRVMVTDKIFHENPRTTRKRLLERLRSLFQVDHVIVIPREPYDVVGHADGVVRFLEEDIVVINDYSKVDLGYRRRLEPVLENHGLQVTRLPYFSDGRTHDGIPSAVGTYVNFLRVGRLVILPAFGVPQDEAAQECLKGLCPRLRITSVFARALGREGGLLNCIAWTVQT